jgi:hypothetical protein
MTKQGDDLPALVIQRARFSDLDGLTREFSQLLYEHIRREILMPSRTCSERLRDIGDGWV